MNKILFDGEKATITFNGSCEEMRSICKAMCCRLPWTVGLSQKEFESNKFQAEPYCLITRQTCMGRLSQCVNRKYRLLKDKNGACIHLNEENKCTVHELKPIVCREAPSCDHGIEWKISGPSTFTEKKSEKNVLTSRELLEDQITSDIYKSTKLSFLKHLHDNQEWVLNPIKKVKTLYYAPKKCELIFIIKFLHSSSLTIEREYPDNHDINDEGLLLLIKLFDEKDNLNEVIHCFHEHYNSQLSANHIQDFAWILFKHNLLLLKM